MVPQGIDVKKPCLFVSEEEQKQFVISECGDGLAPEFGEVWISLTGTFRLLQFNCLFEISSQSKLKTFIPHQGLNN